MNDYDQEFQQAMLRWNGVTEVERLRQSRLKWKSIALTLIVLTAILMWLEVSR
jgi:hypothetical protein